MGYPESEIRTALQAAFGNTERAGAWLVVERRSGYLLCVALRPPPTGPIVAVDYLLNGIPAGALAASMRGPASGPGNSTGGGSTGAVPAGSAVGPDHPLAVLRQHPQFNQLKSLIQTNPGALPQVLQQIGAASPQLLELITANQAAFVGLMNEPIEGGGGGEDYGDEDDGGDDGGDMEGGGGGGGGEFRVAIYCSPGYVNLYSAQSSRPFFDAARRPTKPDDDADGDDGCGHDA